jgi:hypothetical protein
VNEGHCSLRCGALWVARRADCRDAVPWFVLVPQRAPEFLQRLPGESRYFLRPIRLSGASTEERPGERIGASQLDVDFAILKYFGEFGLLYPRPAGTLELSGHRLREPRAEGAGVSRSVV